MPSVRINPAARQDLVDIMAYIAYELSSPETAKRIITKILNACDKLAYFPFSGKRLSAIVEKKNDFRFISSAHYIIFYKVNNEYVSIYRIIYGRRDYMKILFP